MNPADITSLIDKVGYPVAVSIILLIGIRVMARYFIKRMDKQDEDYKSRLEARDKMMNKLIDDHRELQKASTEAIKENTAVLTGLKTLIETINFRGGN